MRSILLVPLLAISAAVPALGFAQADRYGGVGSYPTPAQTMAQARPARVLSWSGKTLPAPPNSYGAPYPPQAYGAPPQAPTYYPAPDARYAPQRPVAAGYTPGAQPQPYYAPAPAGPTPPPGSTATAPNGVYPANTVPPQLAHPMAVPPQMAAPLVTPSRQPPTSIYAPPPAAAAEGAPGSRRSSQLGDDTRAAPQPQRVAANTSAQGARLYSLHRQFGLHPDPTPVAAPDSGEAVELVTAIDSGGPPEPASEGGTTVRTRQTDSKGKTTTRTSRLRGDDSAEN